MAQTAPATTQQTPTTPLPSTDAQTRITPQVAGTAEPAVQPDQPGDVIVTGSRISSAGFTAPTPTKVLTAAAIETRGTTNIGEFLNEIPSFRNTSGSTTAAFATFGAGQNYADLRGLGNVRTLTLVDGRRFVPSSAFGQVDLNLIPTILVDRVDVVTGGASAAYGSDAITGVVNLIINKRLQGFKGDISSGISDYGDNAEKRVSLAYGTSFAQDRGHFVIGGDYVDNNGVPSIFDRPWGARQDGLVSYVGARAADQPSRFYGTGVQFVNLSYGGLIIGANADLNPANGIDALRGIQFGAGGVPQAFNYGNFASFGTGSTLATGNTGGNQGLFAQDRFPIAVPVRRRVGMAHLDFDVTDTLNLFVDGSYGHSGISSVSPPVRDTSTTGAVIRRDNAFLPASIGAIMDANAITSFAIGREYDDFGPVATHNTNETYRIVGGFTDKFARGWSVSGYYENGANIFYSEVDRLRIEQNFRFALDAVNVGGQVVCRATIPGASFNAAAAGCVPINVFGVGSESAAAINYVTGTIHERIKTKEQVGAVTVNGELFSTGAGPVAIAFGGEIRREDATANTDAISQASGFNYSNPKPFGGSYTVKEGFGEVALPLLKDSRYGALLDLNAAARYTDYTTSGGVTTWKVGGTYAPINDIRFRVTRSRDIRAPNNSELYGATSAISTLRNPFSGATNQITVFNQSSPTLRPEKSDTLTAGVVLSPRFIPGLSLSVDYYNIKINGAISSFTAQNVLDSCATEQASNSTPFFCNFVSRTGTGAATVVNSVSVQLLNIASIRARGLDFEAAYRRSIGDNTLSLHGFATYTKDLIFDDGTGVGRTYNAAGVIQSVGGVINRAGSVGGFTATQNTSATNSPHWISNTSATLEHHGLRGTIEGRYVGGGKFDNSLVGPGDPDYNPASPISIASNRVAGRFYLDLSGSIDVIADGHRKLQFYGVVSNVTNVDPPFPTIAIAGIYDRIGRYYRAGVRFTY